MTNVIYKLRQTLNITQKHLAQATGIQQGMIANYEAGRRHPIIKTAFKIIQYAKERGVEICLHEFYADLHNC